MLTDSMIAERLRQSSEEFRALEEAHHNLDLELIQLQKRHVLTPADRKSTRLNSSHSAKSRMPSSA